jgi:molecular chaperone Hsp33
MSSSQVYRFVSNDFRFRISVVEASKLVEEMRQSRELSPWVAASLGELIVGASLLATHLKSGQGVGLLVKGSGSLEKLYAEAFYDGPVRAYCPHPQWHPDAAGSVYWRAPGQPAWEQAIGEGQLNVVRHQPFQRSPFHGVVEFTPKPLALNLESYLWQSQQIPSAIYLLLRLSEDLSRVSVATGVLLEVMPGVEKDHQTKLLDLWRTGLPMLENWMLEHLPVTEAKDNTEESRLRNRQAKERELKLFFSRLFPEDPVTDIPHPHELYYHCPCTKERVLDAMRLWGEQDIQMMLVEGGQETATCQMCGRIYRLQPEDLQEILRRIRRDKLH